MLHSAGLLQPAISVSESLRSEGDAKASPFFLNIGPESDSLQVMSAIRKALYRLAPFYWRIFKPLTLGSRAIVVRNQKVLLVRLSYARGWYLPGGGVAKGESFLSGLCRELQEECAIDAQDAELFGLYFTTKQKKIDHVAIYVVREFKELSNSPHDPEIEESRFFAFDALPADTSPATKRRLQEFVSGAKRSEQW